MDTVVIEGEVLNYRVAGIRCDAVDEDDDAFPPFLDIDVCSGWARDSIAVFAAALAFPIASASESASTVKLS